MKEVNGVAMLVVVPKSLRTRVKIAAARKNCTIARLVAEALEAHLDTMGEVEDA